MRPRPQHIALLLLFLCTAHAQDTFTKVRGRGQIRSNSAPAQSTGINFRDSISSITALAKASKLDPQEIAETAVDLFLSLPKGTGKMCTDKQQVTEDDLFVISKVAELLATLEDQKLASKDIEKANDMLATIKTAVSDQELTSEECFDIALKVEPRMAETSIAEQVSNIEEPFGLVPQPSSILESMATSWSWSRRGRLIRRPRTALLQASAHGQSSTLVDLDVFFLNHYMLVTIVIALTGNVGFEFAVHSRDGPDPSEVVRGYDFTYPFKRGADAPAHPNGLGQLATIPMGAIIRDVFFDCKRAALVYHARVIQESRNSGRIPRPRMLGVARAENGNWFITVSGNDAFEKEFLSAAGFRRRADGPALPVWPPGVELITWAQPIACGEMTSMVADAADRFWNNGADGPPGAGLGKWDPKYRFEDIEDANDIGAPAGTCAGSKLKAAITAADSRPTCLAEVWYSPTRQPAQIKSASRVFTYRNGEAVPSCRTCQYVITPSS